MKTNFLYIALFLLSIACSQELQNNAPINSTESKPGSARAKISAGALLIDVRTPEEYKSGHLKNAVNIPYDQLESHLSQIGDNKDRSIVLYCRSGRRSGIAKELLVKLGYRDVVNGGGIEELRDE